MIIGVSVRFQMAAPTAMGVLVCTHQYTLAHPHSVQIFLTGLRRRLMKLLHITPKGKKMSFRWHGLGGVPPKTHSPHKYNLYLNFSS